MTLLTQSFHFYCLFSPECKKYKLKNMKSFKNLFPFVNIYVTITLIWAKNI